LAWVTKFLCINGLERLFAFEENLIIFIHFLEQCNKRFIKLLSFSEIQVNWKAIIISNPSEGKIADVLPLTFVYSYSSILLKFI
jgi:hypothetical protein